jgi:hypothetical protein
VRSEVVVSSEPVILEALWRRVLNEELGSRLRKVAFLNPPQSEMLLRFGVPADAKIAVSFAGPPGMVNVGGCCFAIERPGGTLFVHWTEASSLTGKAKRDAVHNAINSELTRRFGVAPLRSN